MGEAAAVNRGCCLLSFLSVYNSVFVACFLSSPLALSGLWRLWPLALALPPRLSLEVFV